MDLRVVSFPEDGGSNVSQCLADNAAKIPEGSHLEG
jgi:hypothetical protein